MVQAWIGPAIVAAVIAGLINVLGWFVTHRQERQAEAARRKERIRDCMTALRAEIRCHDLRWTEDRAAAHIAAMRDRINDIPGFTPFVPREVPSAVFAAILPEIHILPGEVIDSVVRFYRQADTVAQVIEDMRSEAFKELDASRKAAFYADYIALRVESRRIAESAIAALEGARDAR